MSLVNAVQNGNIILVKKLLDEGTDPNIQTTNGYTALILVSLKGHTDIRKLLLNHGANPNIQNKYGETALYWARGDEDFVELLTHHMNSIKIQSRFRGNVTRHIAKTQKAYQQIYTALLPVDFDVASMIGDYLSRMPYDPAVVRRMS